MSPSRIELGQVSEDAHARLIYVSNVFGRVYFRAARDPFRDRVRSLPPPLRPEMEELLDGALYAVLQVLDGVTDHVGNDNLKVEFVLSARLRDKANRSVVDEIELGPNGEGLCMGFHGWVEGDFGDTPT